ncbi:MAG: hypothetical protein V3R45_01235 [Candidatus Aminicenantaceae bacterium]
MDRANQLATLCDNGAAFYLVKAIFTLFQQELILSRIEDFFSNKLEGLGDRINSLEF